MEKALQDGDPRRALQIAHVILRSYPRHLATYWRIVRAAWQMRRWDQGDLWGRRLLRADPANALAWRAVAISVEQRGERARAHARWQRAFECDPYEADIRAGLARTSVDVAHLPEMNEACLANLYMRGRRWEQAANLQRQLVKSDPQRLDFQSGLLISLWQQRANREAYQLARSLTQMNPHLLIGWAVIDDVGDVNDKALARHPLTTMDPDGEYVRTVWGIPRKSCAVAISATTDELLLLAQPTTSSEEH